MNTKTYIRETRDLIAKRLEYAEGSERANLMHIDCKLRMAQEPIWRAFASRLCNGIDLGDDDTICGEFGRWPLKFWIVKPEFYGVTTRLQRAFPWRFRTALAGLVLDWMFRYCTRCGQKITLRELFRRDDYLIRFMSGSACHRDCQPISNRRRGDALLP